MAIRGSCGRPVFRFRRALVVVCCGWLNGCGTLHSLSGPLRDAPCLYSGLRLDWAAWQGDSHYLSRYRQEAPAHPAADLPLSFAADSLLLPLAVPRAIYQAIFVPSGL